MTTGFSKAISVVLALCTVLSVCMLGSVVNNEVSAKEFFEAENSYLTYDEYRSLNLYLGSAESCDRDAETDPLSIGSSLLGVRLADVKYGWSNPQVLAVMASAPYWSELSYGTGLASAGNTSFTVSTDTTNSSSKNMNVKLGVSVSASATTEIMGNGITAGASLSETLSFAEAAQQSKTQGTSHTFTAGAGEDYVALMVIPVASYKYEYTVKGKTEYMVVNIQLDPVYGLATLDSYNTVAKSHNEKEVHKERMMPVINLDSFAEGYVPGDPSTYPSSVSDINTSFNVACGDMIIDRSCELINGEVGENQITGKVYSCNEFASIGLGTASFAQSVKFTESEGNSMEQGVVIGASVFQEISAGADFCIGKVTAKAKVEMNASIGATLSYSTVNTEGLTYTMTFVNLPQSAVTGVTPQGKEISAYSFKTKLAVWVPEKKGVGVWSAPTVVLPVVNFEGTETLPPCIPQDLHVLSVSDSAALIGWNKAENQSNREAEYYKLMISTKGSENSYQLHSRIDSQCTEYRIESLKPATTYNFALKAVAYDGTESVTGAPVTVITKSDSSPVILTQPCNICVDEGDKAEFTVIPQGSIDDYTYQWYRMSQDRYGTSWKALPDAEENTFNAAYFAPDGKVNSVNRTDLDGSVYRCLVTDKKSGINVASDCAKLTVTDTHLIDSYNELKQIAIKISMGDSDYANRDYNLGCDIIVPQGETWTMSFGSAENPYKGEFDGNGHTIYDFTFNNTSASCAGFFGSTEGASIENLNLSNVSVTGGDYAGGIVGKALDTDIENCSAEGFVEGSLYVGGIAGYLGDGSEIEDCFSDASLKNSNSQGYTGGVAGCCCESKIEDVYAECVIAASGTKGGIAGFNSGVICNALYNTAYFKGNAVGKGNGVI